MMNEFFTKYKVVFFYLLAVLPSVGFAQTDTAFSIKDCLEYASINNIVIRVARLEQEVGIKQIKEVRGRALPQVKVTGSLDDRTKLPFIVVPPSPPGFPEGIRAKSGYQFTDNITGEITQALFDPTVLIGIKAAQYNNLLYKQKTYQVTVQAAQDIATAYYQVVVAKKQIGFLQTNVANTSKTLANTKLQVENGVAKPVDAKRIQVNLTNSQAQLRQAQLTLDQSLNDLKYNMGMPLEKQIQLSDTMLAFDSSENFLPPGAIFYENRIEYKILKSNLGLQKLDVKNINSGYLPVFTGYINYGYVGQGATFGLYENQTNHWVQYDVSAVGARLNFPVFDGLQRTARAQQSQIKAREIQQNMLRMQQTVNHDVTNAYLQYRNNAQRIEYEKQNVELAQEVYQITQLQFREGAATSTEVVDAETALRLAQNTYTQSLLQLYTARLALEKSKGSLLEYLNSKQ